MKKYFILLVCLISFSNVVNAEIMAGGVMKTGMGNSKRIVDSATNMPVAGAKVVLPKLDYITVTDENGAFNLNTKVNAPTILSVQKDGYRPFSLTIDEKIATRPMIVGI